MRVVEDALGHVQITRDGCFVNGVCPIPPLQGRVWRLMCRPCTWRPPAVSRPLGPATQRACPPSHARAPNLQAPGMTDLNFPCLQCFRGQWAMESKPAQCCKRTVHGHRQVYGKSQFS